MFRRRTLLERFHLTRIACWSKPRMYIRGSAHFGRYTTSEVAQRSSFRTAGRVNGCLAATSSGASPATFFRAIIVTRTHTQSDSRPFGAAAKRVLKPLVCAGCIAGVAFATLLGGCADVISPAHPLDPRSFLIRAPDAPSEGPVDKTWPPLYNTQRLTPADSGRNDPANRPISKTVREAVVTPEIAANDVSTPSPTAPSATAPATQPAGGNTTAVDEVIGSVLGDVDSDPIYADKVLAVLDRALAAEAKKYDATRFREVAADLIQRQVMEFIHADVEFTAAKRNLEPKDEQIATQETIRWRAEQVAHAGGSVELAKRWAIEKEGTTLEELAREHYRLTMTQLYYQRRVVPQIQISASDIRDYYQANRDKDFTQPALVRFRVIRIDNGNAGGADQAIDKIRQLRERIENGGDFAQVAGQVNDDALLLANKGDPQPGEWMSRGAFVSKPVDDAIWNLQPGQMTKIIKDGDSVYLAKLEQRKGGTVQAFEDQEVQEKIYETLRRSQFNTLRQQVRDELEKKAAIRLNPDMMEVPLEMVMQKYPAWAGTAE